MDLLGGAHREDIMRIRWPRLIASPGGSSLVWSHATPA